ncbi:MAG: hypothetical protein LBD06_04085 [Candidatus Accumulibacter sp.]|nr:hypothetical protein [Accumulibacter sp.]
MRRFQRTVSEDRRQRTEDSFRRQKTEDRRQVSLGASRRVRTKNQALGFSVF